MISPQKSQVFREPAASSERLGSAISGARDGLLALQQADGHWCFELESDCTIPAEYILMMHYMDEIDEALQQRLARYLRAKQCLGTGEHQGWPLYQGGAIDISCSVKCYYALKIAGDSTDAPHMRAAREAILRRGGAARSNVFTRILLAMFEQVPWRAAPYVPVEIMLLPKWSPLHLDKVSYWARTVMVPLIILCSMRARAKNPSGTGIRELFTIAPENEKNWFARGSALNNLFLSLDKIGHAADPLIPSALRKRAIRKAEAWFTERLNGEDGLGAIFPAMVNAYEAMTLLGYPKDHPLRATCLKSIQKLVVERTDGSAYCQPCVSPVWDTGWCAMALLRTDGDDSGLQRSLDWLLSKQEMELKGDWAVQAPKLPPACWAFQYANPYYPDLDDTAMVAGVLHLARGNDPEVRRRVDLAANWLVGMQSANGAFAAFDANNTHYYLNAIPFADHGALLDPPTEDVSGRVMAFLGLLKRPQDREPIRRCVEYLKSVQQPDGSWWGRWGTNYIYGTWSVLGGLSLIGEDLRAPYIRKAVDWLKSRQKADGGWDETNDSYLDPNLAGRSNAGSSANSTAWALLGLMAAGEVASEAVQRGIDFLLDTQGEDGLWQHPSHNAPGFPRVFYLKYHGYTAYFPLWALSRYRRLLAS